MLKIILDIIYANISELFNKEMLFFLSFQLSIQSNSVADSRNNALFRENLRKCHLLKERVLHSVDRWTNEPLAIPFQQVHTLLLS